MEFDRTTGTKAKFQNSSRSNMSKAVAKKAGSGNAASKKQESVSKGSIASFFGKPNTSSSSSANAAVEQPVAAESPPVVQQENIGNDPIASQINQRSDDANVLDSDDEGGNQRPGKDKATTAKAQPPTAPALPVHPMFLKKAVTTSSSSATTAPSTTTKNASSAAAAAAVVTAEEVVLVDDEDDVVEVTSSSASSKAPKKKSSKRGFFESKEARAVREAQEREERIQEEFQRELVSEVTFDVTQTQP